MANEVKLEAVVNKSKLVAREGKRLKGGPPIAPRKALARAKKASKKLDYPLSPYPGAGVVQIYRWAIYEWARLGKWQRVAAPVIILTALLTWERERALQDVRWNSVEKQEVRAKAREIYLGPPARKRKLFGLIGLPGQ